MKDNGDSLFKIMSMKFDPWFLPDFGTTVLVNYIQLIFLQG